MDLRWLDEARARTSQFQLRTSSWPVLISQSSWLSHYTALVIYPLAFSAFHCSGVNVFWGSVYETHHRSQLTCENACRIAISSANSWLTTYQPLILLHKRSCTTHSSCVEQESSSLRSLERLSCRRMKIRSYLKCPRFPADQPIELGRRSQEKSTYKMFDFETRTELILQSLLHRERICAF